MREPTKEEVREQVKEEALRNRIPSPDDIRAAIEREKSKHIHEFYERNMDRIIGVLQDFIKNPTEIPSNNRVWLNIYEMDGYELSVKRKYMFHKELNLILDNLRANGYTCWYGERLKRKYSASYKVVSLEINFEEPEKPKGFWQRLFSREG